MIILLFFGLCFLGFGDCQEKELDSELNIYPKIFNFDISDYVSAELSYKIKVEKINNEKCFYESKLNEDIWNLLECKTTQQNSIKVNNN